MNWRRLLVILLGTIGAVGFFSSFGVFYRLKATSPTTPNPVAGQVYQLSDHGYLFYVTREEAWFLNVLLCCILLTALAALLNYRWKVVKNLTARGWRYPT